MPELWGLLRGSESRYAISTEQIQSVDDWTGRTSISLDDSDFWYTLCSIQAPLSLVDTKVLSEQYTKRLAECNNETHNCGKLIYVLIQRLDSFFNGQKPADLDLIGLENAWFFLRTVFTQLNVSQVRLFDLFSIQSDEDEALLENRVYETLDCLVECLQITPQDLHQEASLYDFQVEVSTVLLILLAERMKADTNRFAVKNVHIIQTLLRNFAQSPPSSFEPSDSSSHHRRSGFASSVMSLFSTTRRKVCLLARNSTFILLILVFLPSTRPGNRARRELSTLQDPELFENLCVALPTALVDRVGVLLFYTLLYTNRSFRTTVIESSELSAMLVPLLKSLYEMKNLNSSEMYMSVVCVVILSQEKALCRRIHSELILPRVNWYAERVLTNISLGSLLILVLLRLIQKNITQLQDPYLHTNTIAALSNIVSFAEGLHQHTAEKWVDLVTLLCRKESLMRDRLHETVREEKHAAYVECIDLLLNLMTQCLSPFLLPTNAQLIYALLQHQDDRIFGEGISQVVACFRSFIQSKEGGGSDRHWTIDAVLRHIHDACTTLPDIQVQQQHLFQYSEDQEPRVFFVPYLATLVRKV